MGDKSPSTLGPLLTVTSLGNKHTKSRSKKAEREPLLGGQVLTASCSNSSRRILLLASGQIRRGYDAVNPPLSLSLQVGYGSDRTGG